jgi:hypothetical protein
MAEVDEPAQPWVDALRTLVKVGDKKPSGKPLRKHKAQRDHTSFAIAAIPAALKLPDGTLHLEVRTTPNREWLAAQPRKPPPVPVIAHTSHLLRRPGRTPHVDGPSPRTPPSRPLRCVRRSIPRRRMRAPPRRGASRPRARSAGGFLTLAAVAMTAAGDTSDEELRKARDALTSLATMPSGGGDPVPFGIVATPAAGGIASGGDVSFRILLPIGLMVKAADASPPIF